MYIFNTRKIENETDLIWLNQLETERACQVINSVLIEHENRNFIKDWATTNFERIAADLSLVGSGGQSKLGVTVLDSSEQPQWVLVGEKTYSVAPRIELLQSGLTLSGAAVSYILSGNGNGFNCEKVDQDRTNHFLYMFI